MWKPFLEGTDFEASITLLGKLQNYEKESQNIHAKNKDTTQ